jgi:hypothetical protein
MPNTLAAMEVGLRVVSATSYGKNPDPADILQLEAMAPQFAHLPPEELACEVMQRALQIWDESRRAG